MQKIRVSLVAAGALFAGCLFGAVARDLVVPARAQGTPPLAFEYTVLAVGGWGADPSQPLNRYGGEGWHLVALNGNAAVMERARQWVAAPPAPAR